MIIGITGATGSLGKLAIEALQNADSTVHIIALVRNMEKASNYADMGIEIRHADYDKPESLNTSLIGINRLLMISGSEVGKRVPQHKAVIDAALASKIDFVAYTSLLHADTSPIVLAEEHRQTEAYLVSSGLPHAILRNGWYFENHLASIQQTLEHGALVGSAGDARISGAARADYAQAAIKVLLAPPNANTVFELAGDTPYSLSDLAAEISAYTNKSISYHDVDMNAYQTILEGAGLPPKIARLYAQLDDGAKSGTLQDDSRVMSGLLNRPTTSVSVAVKAAVDNALSAKTR